MISAEERAAEDRRLALARIPKSEPMPPMVVHTTVLAGRMTQFLCRRCATNIKESWWNHCPQCGQKVKHYAKGGAWGWNHDQAEFVWEAMKEGGS